MYGVFGQNAPVGYCAKMYIFGTLNVRVYIIYSGISSLLSIFVSLLTT